MYNLEFQYDCNNHVKIPNILHMVLLWLPYEALYVEYRHVLEFVWMHFKPHRPLKIDRAKSSNLCHKTGDIGTAC